MHPIPGDHQMARGHRMGIHQPLGSGIALGKRTVITQTGSPKSLVVDDIAITDIRRIRYSPFRTMMRHHSAVGHRAAGRQIMGRFHLFENAMAAHAIK